MQFPKGFDNLVYLYLNDNNIESISLNGYLPHLSLLSLKNNNLKSIPDNILQLAPNLSSLYLGNNPKPDELSTLLEDIPNQNHLQHYVNYLEQRKIGTLKPNNECKVLLIGNGKAGKSAIVNRIVNDKFDPAWNSTHGISLLQKSL